MSGDQELILERAGLGARLRAARADAGLSLDEAAARARVPRRHIAAIEDGDAASLPAATYGIAFVKAYAGALGLDGHAASRTYRRGIERPVARTSPIEPPSPVVAHPPARPARWPWLVAAAVLLLLPIGYGIQHAVAPDAPGIAPVAETPHPMAAPPEPVAPPPLRVKSPPAPAEPEQDEAKSGDSSEPADAKDTSSQDRRSRRHHRDDATIAGDAGPAATPAAAPPATGAAPATVADGVPAPPAAATPHSGADVPTAAPPPHAAAPPPAASPTIAAPAATAPAPPGT